MCGIAGSLSAVPAPHGAMVEAVGRMVASLVHRGPDDSGVWGDPETGVCLGNRRLAIMDLSAAGHQPMPSPGGRYVLALNGEIYNHLDLRDRLAAEGRAPAWRGHSDTETLGAAIEAWGVTAALAATIGMFGLAVWDRQERRLTLARDRIGEKPLYYGRFGGTWLFGSELKALLAHPDCRPEIDPDAFSTYMALGYVPAPASIWRGIRKVMPGRTLTFGADDATPVETTYWSATDAAEAPQLAFPSDRAATDALEELLLDAVTRQMLSDRPLGAFLSGGVDSTTLVALMTAAGRSHVRTFSIGFNESSFNEADFASRIARHFATEHTELYVTAADVADTIQRLPAMYDEPFSDMSQIPTYLVSKLASGSVTVSLSGDGGDELFGGYPRYDMGRRMWQGISRIPAALRPGLGALLEKSARPGIDEAFTRAFPHDDVSGVRGLRPAQKLAKLGRAMKSRDVETLYWQLLAPWSEPALQRHPPDASPFPRMALGTDARTVPEAFMVRDLLGYLPDDILAKVDRASMAASLESRAPMLDHRVVEFALRLPLDYKFRRGTGKWLLRQVLDRHIPRRLVDRPKMGFVMPMASWLRGPLKAWAYDLVASANGRASDLVDTAALRRMLDRHVQGHGDWNQPLWAALMFLAWADHAEAQRPA